MKAAQLLAAHPPSIDLASYRHAPRGMPPLEASKLAMVALIGDQTRGRLIEGDLALLLSYKGYDAAVTSWCEEDDGETWRVPQLQGARSRKSMRVASCFATVRCFADHVKAYAVHPESEVRRLTMPHAFAVTNIDGAEDMESAMRRYQMYASLLGMKFSDEMGMYVLDIRDASRRVLETA